MVFLDHFYQVSNSHANPSYLPENYHDNKASTMNKDVFPIENVDFPSSHSLVFRGVLKKHLSKEQIPACLG